MDKQRIERGQSLLEIAIILPVLLIMLFGLVEVGFGLRNYLLVSNANREAARFASRGRFSYDAVAERLLYSGGMERKGGGVDMVEVTVLRTQGTEPNTGIIITCIPIPSDYQVGQAITLPTRYITGVRWIEDGEGVRPIEEGDSRVVPADIILLHGPPTESINATRDHLGYGKLDSRIVVVETFYAHRPLGRGLLPDPWEMYASTEIRVVADRGVGGSKGGDCVP